MKSELSLIVGRRIRSIRISQGKSMTALAHESEMEYIQLSRIELGNINTSIFQLFKICNALNIRLVDLLNEIEDELLLNQKVKNRKKNKN